MTEEGRIGCLVIFGIGALVGLVCLVGSIRYLWPWRKPIDAAITGNSAGLLIGCVNAFLYILSR